LAADAARRALSRAGTDVGDVDLIVVATCTPDRWIPATAPIVQHALGATRAGAFDVNAACAGFVTAWSAADAMIRAGVIDRALVVGAEVLSRFLDWSDRTTSILFGDGAGAIVLERAEEPAGLLSVELGADGEGAGLIEIPAGGSALPTSAATLDAREHYVRMNGPEVYRAAVRVMSGATERALARIRVKPSDADLVILHQANQRISDEVGERLSIAPERLFSNVSRYGNTSAASVAIALCEAAEEGMLEPGSTLAVCAVGAGMTWSAAGVRWTAPRVSKPAELVGARGMSR